MRFENGGVDTIVGRPHMTRSLHGEHAIAVDTAAPRSNRLFVMDDIICEFSDNRARRDLLINSLPLSGQIQNIRSHSFLRQIFFKSSFF